MTSAHHPGPTMAAVSGLGAAAVVLLLTGCALVDDVAHGYSDARYPSAAALVRDRPDTVPWLPLDARDIQLVSSTRAEGTFSVLLTSEGGLPDDCVEMPRRSAPAFELATAVDVYAIDTVSRCGDWIVAKDGTTLLGWTPAIETQGVEETLGVPSAAEAPRASG